MGMKSALALIAIGLCASGLPNNTLGQSAPSRPELSPFTTICIEEKASGFQWSRGQWKGSEFRPDLKYTIQKLSKQQVEESPIIRVVCTPGQSAAQDNWAITYGCYNMRKMGEKFEATSTRTCLEYWRDGNLLSISCKDLDRPFTFLPDGEFIAFPWHSDISSRPKDDYKDSLAISVGKCSKVK